MSEYFGKMQLKTVGKSPASRQQPSSNPAKASSPANIRAVFGTPKKTCK